MGINFEFTAGQKNMSPYDLILTLTRYSCHETARQQRNVIGSTSAATSCPRWLLFIINTVNITASVIVAAACFCYSSKSDRSLGFVVFCITLCFFVVICDAKELQIVWFQNYLYLFFLFLRLCCYFLLLFSNYSCLWRLLSFSLCLHLCAHFVVALLHVLTSLCVSWWEFCLFLPLFCSSGELYAQFHWRPILVFAFCFLHFQSLPRWTCRLTQVADI